MARMKMGRLAAMLFLPLVLASCARVPITGRWQPNLIDKAELNAMSFQAYDEFLEGHKVSTNADQTQLVKRVGVRIQNAVEEHFARENEPDYLAGYEWEFSLVESEEVNAWCMPGGKVVIYTGILPVAGNETGLAVVMGHEIAHAIANHGNERMSEKMFVDLGTSMLEDAMATQPEQTRELLLAAVGVGAELGFLLPYSRLHESEADLLGLIFMAMAGYDPREAPKFWERMAALKKGQGPPEFLSTHPSDETRIENLRRLVAEEAMKYYKPPR